MPSPAPSPRVNPTHRPAVQLTRLFGNLDSVDGGRSLTPDGIEYLTKHFKEYPWFAELLKTDEFVRLQGICQMNISYTDLGRRQTHSRFVHSIHAALVAELLADQLKLTQDTKKLLIATMLLHDIGHVPFNHVGESILATLNVPYDHDQKAREKLCSAGSELGKILRSAKISPEEIADILGDDHNSALLISLKDICDRVAFCHEDINSSRLESRVRNRCTDALEKFLDSLMLQNNQLSCTSYKAAEEFMKVRHFVYGLLTYSPPALLGSSVITKAVQQAQISPEVFIAGMSEANVCDFLKTFRPTSSVHSALFEQGGIESSYDAACILPFSALSPSALGSLTTKTAVQRFASGILKAVSNKYKTKREWKPVRKVIAEYLNSPDTCQDIHICITPDYSKQLEISVPAQGFKGGSKDFELQLIKIDARESTRCFMIFMSDEALKSCSIDVKYAIIREMLNTGKLKPQHTQELKISNFDGAKWDDISFMQHAFF